MQGACQVAVLHFRRRSYHRFCSFQSMRFGSQGNVNLLCIFEKALEEIRSRVLAV